MRILIHSNAPWVPTGYGVQGRLLADQLTAAGHKVAFSALSGLGGADVTWRSPAGNRYQVMPSGQMAFGIDVLVPHALRFQADVVITCMDYYKLAHLGEGLRDAPFTTLAWMPVDCTPLSAQDKQALAMTGAIPIAMSRHGEHELSMAGFMPGYAPHAVDTTNEYYPLPDRDAYREEAGLADKFVIGLCAANKDTMRKAFSEQFSAFARLHHKHPDTVMLVHSTVRCTQGTDLAQLATDMEIADSVMFSEQYAQDSGLFDTEMMRRWYNACDLLTLCSYGEGFGVPVIEAQACATPVVVSNASATAELGSVGWLVETDPFWNPVHQAFWGRPRVPAIVQAFSQAYNLSDDLMATRRGRSRMFALDYDVANVFKLHWEPILAEVPKVKESNQ